MFAYDVFISHSAGDSSVAHAICAALERNRIRCWMAPRDILPGKEWSEAIIDGIAACPLMILVFSSRSNHSKHVRRELERAVSKDVTVVPFRIEDVPMSKSMEYFLSTPHWLDAFAPPLDKHLCVLVQTVRSLLDQPEQLAEHRAMRPGGTTMSPLWQTPGPSLRTWRIGSSPDCDLVVDEPAVSGAHCRLTEALGEMILEDLGSTNGTYVNGQRIERPIVVRRSDVVTLGSKTRMPWPDSWSHASGASPAPSVPSPSAETPATAGSRVITVGYDPGNDVVLGFPTVSGHHARLILRNNEIWLEDLHSTNGTAIGSPHNRIQRARITAEDIVYFGSLPIPAARLLAIPNPGLRHDGRIEKLSPNSI